MGVVELVEYVGVVMVDDDSLEEVVFLVWLVVQCNWNDVFGFEFFIGFDQFGEGFWRLKVGVGKDFGVVEQLVLVVNVDGNGVEFVIVD